MVDEEPRAVVERINEKLPYEGVKLALVPMGVLEHVEKNARYMKNETFRALVDNIKRDGALSSVPLCWKHGDSYRILSGNHRIMAAREAGLQEVLILYTDKALSKQEQVAIQLSHNALAGEDDPVILRELWSEIDEVSLKCYAGLDDKLLEELEKVILEPLSEVNLDYRTVSFIFLPEEKERLEAVFKEALETVKAEDVHLAELQEFDRMLEAMAKTSGAYNVRNSATCLMLVLDVFEKHLTDLQNGWEYGKETPGRAWVPIASIFGTDSVPLEAARVIREAVDKIVGREQLTKRNLWRALEHLAADYLEQN